MVAVEKLWGVIHGGSREISAFEEVDQLIGPSRELMRDLLTLRPGSKVAVETCPELWSTFEVDGVEHTLPPSHLFYWQRIHRLCERAGLGVVYLEDFPTYLTSFRQRNNAERLQQENLAALFAGNLTPAMERAEYRAGVEAGYTYMLGREEKLLERVRETQPDVTILGRGHTDPLMAEKETLQTSGVVFSHYQAEDVFIEPGPFANHPRYYRAELDSSPHPDAEMLLMRELLRRKYRAMTEERVLATGTPEFIGTWDPSVIPERGRFEMHYDTQTGWRIEDCLGTAQVNAFSRDGGRFQFTKTYIPAMSDQRADHSPIVYYGDLQSGNGEFVGSDGERRPFVMKKYV